MALDERRLSTRSRANPGGMDVLSVLGPDVRPMRERKPPWFKVQAPGGERYRELTKLIADENLLGEFEAEAVRGKTRRAKGVTDG
ncbi:MAG: hypothetical protein KY463_10805 [Actinobacteria bacterium]|nr:hypothetical protein [Actinomycetota bacterium]